MRRRRQALDVEQRKRASLHISASLLVWADQHCGLDRPLALYAAHHFEPNIDAAIASWLQQGRPLALPRVAQTAQGARLQFVRVHALAELTHSNLGLREAWGPDAHIVPIEQLGAVAVPCLAIDHKGVRLGSGMGIYDRALCGCTAALVGVTFDCQRVASLPSAPHDLTMPTSITEKGLQHHNCQ